MKAMLLQDQQRKRSAEADGCSSMRKILRILLKSRFHCHVDILRQLDETDTLLHLKRSMSLRLHMAKCRFSSIHS